MSRFQIDGLLKDVFRSRARGKRARSHRTFTPQDLIVVAVANEMEQKYGVKRIMLARIGDQLREALTGPRKASREARLVVTFTPPTATYLAPDAPVREGVVVQLGPLFAKVDEYLGASGSSHDSGQAVLPLSPASVTPRRGVSRNR